MPERRKRVKRPGVPVPQDATPAETPPVSMDSEAGAQLIDAESPPVGDAPVSRPAPAMDPQAKGIDQDALREMRDLAKRKMRALGESRDEIVQQANQVLAGSAILLMSRMDPLIAKADTDIMELALKSQMSSLKSATNQAVVTAVVGAFQEYARNILMKLATGGLM